MEHEQRDDTGRGKPVGRRVFLGIAGLGAVGVVLGDRLSSAVGSALAPIVGKGGGLAGLIPGADQFRIYTVTGTLPSVPAHRYRLEVSGLVAKARTFNLEELKALPRTEFTHTFQCVTGWRVPDVAWAGVRLADVLEAVQPTAGAQAVEFGSYDGIYTESLTLEEAHRSDVIVAYEMLGAPVTREHGGPVRLYVAPMYGYKSAKWLKSIRLVKKPTPGFWEQQGYPIEAWIGGQRG